MEKKKGSSMDLSTFQKSGFKDLDIFRMATNNVEVRWSAAGTVPSDPEWAGGTVFTDQRSVEIAADPQSVLVAVSRIGGENGWYADDFLWRLLG